MASANDVLQIATGELGYSRWDDPLQGTKYGRWAVKATGIVEYGYSGVPYCAMFVSYVLRKAKMSILPNGTIYAYCPYIERDAKKAGRTVSFWDIAPGDVLLFDWDGDGVSDHVGFAVRREGNYVHTIEGNTSGSWQGSQSNGGGVYRRVRHKDTIRCVVRPAYSNAPAHAAQPARLIEDGILGPASIQALQTLLGTPVDGEISGQVRVHTERWSCAGAGWVFDDGDGSACIKALQRRLGVHADGYAGAQTITALQKRLGVTADGYAGPVTGKALQRAINQRKL